VSQPLSVAIVTLGCARNDVDSEELAGRLAADGWRLESDPGAADIAVINTCGFIESAKKDSIDALLEAHTQKSDGTLRAVVAVGCLAERYGKELAEALPEADGILSFDDYQDISRRLQGILSGNRISPHSPRDRRNLLPLSPAERQDFQAKLGQGGAANKSLKKVSTIDRNRVRLGTEPTAPLKIASGCDRRCTFCAIPQFRGAFISRRPHEILDEAKWLVSTGVSELFLVSENTTSYGKDLGDLRLLENLLPEISQIEGLERIRLSYLQPAEIRPGLLQAMTSTNKVLPYFDISFQHAAGSLLRRMRRFGDIESFLHLLNQIRALEPKAGIRSNFIVGFPGESEAEFNQLEEFISSARLDAIGIFPYSDEDKTEAMNHSNKIAPELIAERTERLKALAEDVMVERAHERIGEKVRVLIEDSELGEGRADHQGPEVDTTTTLVSRNNYRIGEYVDAIVSDLSATDLIAQPL
jgi:ribosomal protein S12 methylthiotransferase RimO